MLMACCCTFGSSRSLVARISMCWLPFLSFAAFQVVMCVVATEVLCVVNIHVAVSFWLVCVFVWKLHVTTSGCSCILRMSPVQIAAFGVVV
ncbi:unnamed protein product [Lathyrus oleraceus]